MCAPSDFAMLTKYVYRNVYVVAICISVKYWGSSPLSPPSYVYGGVNAYILFSRPHCVLGS